MPVFNVADNGDNYTLRRAIFAATPEAVRQTKKLAEQFCTGTDMGTAKKIWQFLKTQIRYEADGYHQKIKLPSALLREKVGDCKSYSLFTAGILENCGIPWHYMLASYNNDPTPSHIYVMTDSGIIIDAVWNAFNSQKQPVYSYKQKTNDMRISKITGLGGLPSKTIGCSGSSCSCGCQSKVTGCGYPVKGIGANLSPKRYFNAVPRTLMLGLVSTNLGGLATLLSQVTNEELRKVWTSFGGDGNSITKAIQDGINKPIRAKWFYDKLVKIANQSVEAYFKKIGVKGLKGTEDEPSYGGAPSWIVGDAGTFPTTGQIDVPNTTDTTPKGASTGNQFSISAEDLMAFMSTQDSETKAKQVIEWGASALTASLCNVPDPTQLSRAACGVIGKEGVGNIIYNFWFWIKYGLANLLANARSPKFTALTQSDCDAFVKLWVDKIGQTGLVQAFDPSKGTGVVLDMGKKYEKGNNETITFTRSDAENVIRAVYFKTTPESKKFIAEACKKYGICPDLVALQYQETPEMKTAGFGGWIAVGAIALLALGAMKKKR